MEVIFENLITILALLTFSFFAWGITISSINNRRMYDKDSSEKDATILYKTSSIQSFGRSHYTLYEFKVKADNGKEYCVMSDSFRVKRYEVNDRVKIIVPNKEGMVYDTNKKGEYEFKGYNKVIFKFDKDKWGSLILGGLISVMSTVLFVASIIATVMEMLGIL